MSSLGLIKQREKGWGILYFIFISFFYFYFISFAKKNKQTNKKTNKQKERWQGHRNSFCQLQRAWILKKKIIIKTRNVKNHGDTRKTTATYNKLVDETRDEHYYILNR